MIKRILISISSIVKILKYQKLASEEIVKDVEMIKEEMDALARKHKIIFRFTLRQAQDKNKRIAKLEEEIDQYRDYCAEMWDTLNVIGVSVDSLRKYSMETWETVKTVSDRFDALDSEIDEKKTKIKAFLYGINPGQKEL